MARLRVVDTGVLYVNPDPAHEHVFASHPHPLQLSDQEFICTCQRGSALYATDAQIVLLRSGNGGVTWTEEGPLHDRSGDDRAYSYHDGFVSRLADESIVVLAFRADRSTGRTPMFSPSGGLIACEPVRFDSRDGGRTWSRPRVVRVPPGIVATPAGPVMALADGRWLATFDQWPRYDDPEPYRPRMLALVSDDDGQSWSGPTVIADGRADGKGFWHGKTIRLASGRLYTTFWAADLTNRDAGPVDLPLHYAFADRAARAWSTPAPTAIPAQTHWLADLGDDRLAMIYTWRTAAQPGVMALLAEDGGLTWDVDQQVRLWDATGWTHIGVNTSDRYPHSHDTIAFGAPTLLATSDGGLYAAWWCTYASLTHLRWARRRVVE